MLAARTSAISTEVAVSRQSLVEAKAVAISPHAAPEFRLTAGRTSRRRLSPSASVALVGEVVLRVAIEARLVRPLAAPARQLPVVIIEMAAPKQTVALLQLA